MAGLDSPSDLLAGPEARQRSYGRRQAVSCLLDAGDVTGQRKGLSRRSTARLRGLNEIFDPGDTARTSTRAIPRPHGVNRLAEGAKTVVPVPAYPETAG